MTDELKELNDTFFKIFDDLNEARPVLKGIDEAFTCFAEGILDAYKIELRLLQEEDLIRKEREIYKIRRKRSLLEPREWRNWKKFFKKEQNLAQSILDKEVELDTQEFFVKCMKRNRERENSEEKEEKPVKPQESRAEEVSAETQSNSSETKTEAQDLIFALLKTLSVCGARATIPPIEESSKDLEEVEVIEVEDDYGLDIDYEILEEVAEEPIEEADPNVEAESALPNGEAANSKEGENEALTGELDEAGQILSDSAEKASESEKEGDKKENDMIQKEEGGKK